MRAPYQCVALVLAAGLLLPSRVGAQHFPPDQDLELMLRYLTEDAGVPGIVLGVLEADGSTRIVAYGSGGPDARPLGPLSLFDLGSVTKTFTGTLLADAVERGEVALDDPVAEYLPPDVTVPSSGGREITLLDLATHTSGLPMWGRNPDPPDPRNPFADYSVETMYAFLSHYRLPREPGSQYEYSNLGFGLLGHALARANGTTLPALLRERVLEPLGMDMTAYAPKGEDAGWLTVGHEPGDVVPVETDARRGAGGLYSNVRDMLLYLEANIGLPRTELERAMRMAQRARVPTDEGGVDVGLGWRTVTMAGRHVIMHGGRHNGFMAWICFDPERRIGTVLLTNTEAFGDGLGTDLVFLSPPPAEWQAEVDTALLRDYAGKYEGASGQAFYVRLEKEGFLTYQPSGKARARMYAKSDSSFYLLRGPWSFAFHRDDAGDVAAMTMAVDRREPTAQGTTQTARRVGTNVPTPRAVAEGDSWSAWTFPWTLALELAAGVMALFALLALVRRLRRGAP